MYAGYMDEQNDGMHVAYMDGEHELFRVANLRAAKYPRGKITSGIY